MSTPPPTPSPPACPSSSRTFHVLLMPHLALQVIAIPVGKASLPQATGSGACPSSALPPMHPHLQVIIPVSKPSLHPSFSLSTLTLRWLILACPASAGHRHPRGQVRNPSDFCPHCQHFNSFGSSWPASAGHRHPRGQALLLLRLLLLPAAELLPGVLAAHRGLIQHQSLPFNQQQRYCQVAATVMCSAVQRAFLAALQAACAAWGLQG